MANQTLKEAILKAATQFSKRKIDVVGKGKAVKKLQSGQEVTPSKLEEMYQNVLLLQGTTPAKSELPKKVGKELPKEKGQKKEQPTIATLQETLEIFMARQAVLEKRMSSLEKECALVLGQNRQPVLEGKKEEANKPFFGFALVLKTITSNGKKYRKWHAVKVIGGKQKWIYIGKEKAKAQEKIAQWVERQKEKSENINPKDIETHEPSKR